MIFVALLVGKRFDFGRFQSGWVGNGALLLLVEEDLMFWRFFSVGL